MSEALDKAKGALKHAGEIVVAAEASGPGRDGHVMTVQEENDFKRCMLIADVQAKVAIAEALEDIARER